MSAPDDIRCTRCQTVMELIGERRLWNWNASLLNPGEEIYAYVCPSCAALQLFDIKMLQAIYEQRPPPPPVQQ